jgi:hypothetical protein
MVAEMRNVSKSFALILILIVATSSLILIDFIPFGLAQSGTNENGIISSNTTWTTSGSPYTLTGNTLVYQGVTLTIQSGVIVNLGNYYIEVNGTLSAIGNPTDKITFNGGQITFTTLSNGWNEQSKTGCIIENSIINQVSISCSNPIKIDNCIINSQNSQITVTSSIISNNVVTGNINSHSSIPSLGQSNPPVDTSVISGNTVNGNIVLGAVSLGALTAPSEACTVSNNTVYGSIISGSPQGTPQIFNNTVSQGGIACDGYGSIFNNYVYGCQTGVSLYTMRVFGGNLPCYATVESNIITGNSYGIGISLSDVNGGLGQQYCPTILNNTVSGNTVGISLSGFGYTATPIIKYNNLLSSSNYTFYLQESNNADLSNNWWETTNQQTINQSIYDFKNDFNLGVVTFTPFLTAPNPQAPAYTPTPSPTPSPTPIPTATSSPTANQTSSPISSPTSSTSTATPTVPEFPTWIALPIFIGVALSLIAIKRKQSSQVDF